MSTPKAGFLKLLTGGIGDKHVYFSIGKGGVGKTTVSILAGIALSSIGKTLVASLDPAKHMKEYLGLKKIGKVERVTGNLFAVQYDIESFAGKISNDYAELLKSILPGLRIVNLEKIADSIRNAPGFEEEVYLRIVESLYSADYKFVVIDTPPTGITHRILNMPQIYKFWLEKLYDIRMKIVGTRYAIARAIGRKVEPHDPALNKIKQLIERYGRLGSKMRDHSHTSIILVATPEPLPVFEVESTLKLIKKLEIRPRVIVVNKVLPDSVAEKLGVLNVQRESIERLRQMKCCPLVMIMHHEKPPRSLEEAMELFQHIKLVD